MKRSLFALALAAALPLTAHATDLKYNYVEADYARTHAFDTSADGYKLKGSVGFGDSFYGIGSYSRVSDSGIDFNEGTLGLGYHHAISDKADWVSELSWVNDEFDAGSLGSTNDDGYRVATGVRGMLGDKFEGNFNVNYTDVNDFGNGVGAGVGAVFHVNDTWGITGGYDYSNRDNSDVNTWTLGARASF